MDEIHENYKGIEKSVDSENQSVSSNNRRGYGGVAVMWSKEIDGYIKSKTEGGVRIQCKEIDISEPILIASVYLPTKADNDRYDEYSDCLDQLFEIVQTYQNTHRIIICGDLNEDIIKPNNSRRAKN